MWGRLFDCCDGVGIARGRQIWQNAAPRPRRSLRISAEAPMTSFASVEARCVRLNAKAADWKLTPAEMKELDGILA